ncbi:GDSL lipase/esterase protein [Dioscorea alata]|uniref:GDSL lipase/esterase protein n=1 Tax=Dioscorea alata TaxID=55571 RepID=A0ACB7WPW8_DIOAL|nr:GDSL lipase/esterase protein [Dioscorea alata]
MAAPLQYSLLLLPFLCLFLALAFSSGEADRKVPAIFIFGDSSADVGNNKYLSGGKNITNNFLPYGIDYPSTNGRNATGRYSNGYNGADVLAHKHTNHKPKYRSPPPYLSLKIDNHTKEINITQAKKNGINFASGGSTLLWESNCSVISMTQQMEDFRNFWLQLNETMSSQQIDQLLSKSLFFISIGDNDIGAFLHEAFPNYDIKFPSFISNLTATYGNHLKDLYKLGGRKFGIANFVPIGYIPKVKERCNHELEVLMNNLSSTLPGMKYSIGSSYDVFMKIIDNPGALDRRQYLFWDDVHPTEATTRVFGDLVYNGSTEYASPINFKELAEDDNDLISMY